MLLDDDFDLTPRSLAGRCRSYACSDVFCVLDAAGRVAHYERRAATLHEEQIASNGDGASRLRWTYASFRHEVGGVPGNEPHAFPSSGRIVFEGVPERAGSYVPPLASLGLVTTSPAAWLTAELVIHTRAFVIMATRAHGAIERLRRIGDTTTMPWSDAQDRLVFGELFEVTIVRSLSVLGFEGLTTAGGRPAALVGFHCPYDLRSPAFGDAHVEVRGSMSIDLASGAVLGGVAHQANYIAEAPRADGSAGPMAHRIETSLELAAE